MNNCFATIGPEIKSATGMMPFVTMPLTRRCNFRCLYCGAHGEAGQSEAMEHDYETLRERIFMARRQGVNKFRLSGGEPLLYPHFGDLIRLFNQLGVETLVNTNGSMIEEYRDLFADMQDNIRFAVSFDTTRQSVFNRLSDTRGMMRRVMRGIELVRQAGKLRRLNMVVTTLNYDDVFDVIRYCVDLGCDLKIFDVITVPTQFSERNDLYVSLDKLEEELSRYSVRIHEHQYARSFGTPCKIYHYKGVNITVKSTGNGAHYDVEGICRDCPYYPCHEGLYYITLLPDRQVVGCRWAEQQLTAHTNDFTAQLQALAQIFRRAIYVPRTREQPLPAVAWC